MLGKTGRDVADFGDCSFDVVDPWVLMNLWLGEPKSRVSVIGVCAPPMLCKSLPLIIALRWNVLVNLCSRPLSLQTQPGISTK